MKLQNIGLECGTDKSKHMFKNMSYLDFYEKHFDNIRENVTCFVEIGVLNGNSLKMWSRYFPNATIYGIDINPNCRKFETEKIKILIGDQNDDNFLKEVSSMIPIIDILIDDGSHITSHQIKTFNYLYPNIKEGGFYVIEDLRNSYEEFFNHHDIRSIWPGMSLNKPQDNLKNFRSELNEWIHEKIKKLDFHEETNLKSIHHYPMIIIFEN